MNWMGFLFMMMCLVAGCRDPAEVPTAGEAPSSGGTVPAPRQPSHTSWYVIKNEHKVLWIKNEPGCLISTAILPYGEEPKRHPFLTSMSFDAFEEDNLRQLLEKSGNFDDFVALLKKNGYEVVPDSP